jgi:hypothetical protein
VQRAGPVRVFEDDTTPADWVRSAEAILADLPEDFTEARVIDLQKVCAALRVSKTGVQFRISSGTELFLLHFFIAPIRSCMSMGTAKMWIFGLAGKKQVLIDRINETLAQYTQALDKVVSMAEASSNFDMEQGGSVEAGAQEAEAAEEEFPTRESQNIEYMGNLEAVGSR